MALPIRIQRVLQDPEAFEREFNGLVRRMFAGQHNGANGVADSQPAGYPVDVYEDAHHLHVEAELPGFKRDEIDVTLDASVLTITAQRTVARPDAGEQIEPGVRKGEYLLNERRSTRLQRSFTLPPTVDETKVDAKYADGVLSVTVSKREENKPRKISVA